MMDRDSKGRFEKGREESPEERIKRINASRDAWKSRDDYIGDIKNLCPHIYTVWRGIRFTKKAKKIGCSKEWEDFRTFFNDVYPSYQDGLLFRRPDVSRPYSKDNFIWVTKEDEAAFRSNSVYLTFNGETFLLKDWAEKLNLSLAGLRLRYHRYKDTYSSEEILFGRRATQTSSEKAKSVTESESLTYNGETLSLKDWANRLNISLAGLRFRYYHYNDIHSAEEILFGRRMKRGSKKAKGITDPNVKVRAKASTMISAYKNKDKKMGVSICDMDIEWMVLNILTKPCIYCGDTYRIGADRIENTEGHTKKNVVPCCYECNCARNANFTFEEMKIIGQAIRQVKESRDVEKKDPTTLIESSLIVHNPSEVRWGEMKVYQYDLDWNLIKVYDSIKQAAMETGFETKGIGAACNGRDYKKEHKYRGYRWEHK